MEKILIPIYGQDIAPRFDLATEVVILIREVGNPTPEERMMVLPQASAEQLCHLILSDGIATLICGGIEEEYFQYLSWKKVKILDSVMGPWQKAAELFMENRLKAGENLHKRRMEGKDVS
ncbi:NifB/NifX family molybdenum-iron cluster-binding protein [Desulfobotulus mexicanus]|uniref:Dinitrogenase iron-molybdenum cofactor biosynthesis protein n=1 Tax=Desulfobotulus mexicanus TaxID=2586642 RepID=A0A5Q4VGU6_9BACT|nr:dinitrogenase iron-molybdenum cofactor biosynthesis protein [Desulfobotulus mexicanus]TYT76086.1 dinitrogenase iron-molybdenum cofactor biosynthesis protein [Desulfobotulus mexicanus]